MTPYVWRAGSGGDTPHHSRAQLSIDKSFSDELDDLDTAFFLSAYARKDRLVMLEDLSGSSCSPESHLLVGLSATGKLQQRSVTLLGDYRSVEQEDMKIDLLVGTRD